MKIAVFHNLRKGGAKRALYEISKKLFKTEILDLYCFKEDDEFLPIDQFYKHTNRFRFTKFTNFFDYQYCIYFKLPAIHKKIAQVIDDRNYDLVFLTHDYLTKSPYILRYLKTPSIYLCQEPPREFYEQLGLYSPGIKYKLVDILRLPLKIIDQINVKHASLIIGNSNYSCKLISKIYKKKVVLLRHGVDSKKFKFFGHKSKNKFYLTVGSLSVFKGCDFIINSLSKLPKNLKYPLYIVADGGRDSKFIIKKANNLKIKLVIKKNLSDKQLVNLYNQAHIFLFAGIKEPLGLSILEASSCGLPSVVVKEGGVAELIDKKHCLLTDRNVYHFAKAIEILNKRNIDLKYKYKLRSFVSKNWTWKRNINNLKKYLLSVKKI